MLLTASVMYDNKAERQQTSWYWGVMW